MAEVPVDRRRRAVGSAAVFAVILAAAVLLEHGLLSLTPIHDGLEDLAYYAVQRVLAIRPHRDPDVVLIDISGIERLPAPAAWTALNVQPPERTPIVSREALKALISKLPPNCKAVGIDVDFSCEEGHLIPAGQQTVLPDDGDFFRWCLDQEASGRQIFLGVMRQAASLPQDVFGNKKYAGLGALISHPREGWELGTVSAESTRGEVKRESVGKRLADSVSPSRTWIPEWFAGEESDEKGGLTVRRAYIDYHWVPTLYDERVTMAAVMAGKFPAGKVALLGFADKGKSDRGDEIVVPRMSDPYPGVYAHAALAQTLVQGQLIAVRLWPSIFLTFLAEFLVGIAILRAKLKFERNQRSAPDSEEARDREERALANLAKTRASKRVAWLILVFAILLAPFSRILWLGALAAMLNLLLFSPAGEGSEKIFEWFERRSHAKHPAVGGEANG